LFHARALLILPLPIFVVSFTRPAPLTPPITLPGPAFSLSLARSAPLAAPAAALLMLGGALSFARSAPLAPPAALPPVSPLAALGSLAPPLALQVGFVLPNIVIVIIGIESIHGALGQSRRDGRGAVRNAGVVARKALPVAIRTARSRGYDGFVVVGTAATVAAAAGRGGGGVVEGAATALAASSKSCFPHGLFFSLFVMGYQGLRVRVFVSGWCCVTGGSLQCLVCAMSRLIVWVCVDSVLWLQGRTGYGLVASCRHWSQGNM
jgi:hypothetical protein